MHDSFGLSGNCDVGALSETKVIIAAFFICNLIRLSASLHMLISDAPIASSLMKWILGLEANLGQMKYIHNYQDGQ